MEHNKRQHFRYAFQKPLCANMTIVQIKENRIDAKNTKTCILDIGPGGIRFMTPLTLPVNPYVVLEFQTRILDRELHFHGYIVRRTEGDVEFKEYGVKFMLDETEQAELTSLLHLMSIRLRVHVESSSCQFCTSSNHTVCLRSLTLSHEGGDSPSHPFASS